MGTTRLREFLHARKINVSLSKDKTVRQFIHVVPLSDIDAALTMIEEGTLESWIDKMEAQNPYFINRGIKPTPRSI